jgi:mono/diheme cytochrome c family protein
MMGTLLAIVLGVMIIVVGIYELRTTDPYVQEVLAIRGDAEQGKAIFQMNCSSCHGITASGEVGPSLLKVSDRRSATSIIYQVTSGKTPPMPKFQASPSEMADLLSFLKKL